MPNDQFEDEESGSASNVDGNLSSLDEFNEDELFETLSAYVKDVADARSRPVLYILHPNEGFLGAPDALGVYNMLRNLSQEINDLDLILHTPGGDIHEAFNIAKLAQNYTDGELTAFVPMRAMSAGTLIAMAADKLVLSEIGQIGPLDPQIVHPNYDVRMPLRAFTDVINVLDEALIPNSREIDMEVKGDSIIKPIAEQIDPYHLTEYMDADELAREYGQRIMLRRGIEQKEAERCVEYLVDPPSSHEYTIDQHEIREHSNLRAVFDVKGIKELRRGPELEDMLMTITELFLYWDIGMEHDKYTDTRMNIVFPTNWDEEQQDIMSAAESAAEDE